jgi:tetratricopeptide (TPR) repeat protein
MADNSIEVKIRANGMEQAASTIKNGVSQIDSSFSSLSGVAGKITGIFAAFTAVLGGGRLFGEAIQDTVKMRDELMSLKNTLGITVDDAQELAQAIELIRGNTETYSSAAYKLTRQLKADEDGLKSMGLQTRDASGNLRSMKDLMNDALAMVGQYKVGIDRNTVSMYLFGRGAAEMQSLLKLNDEVLKDAKKDIEDFNVQLGPEKQAVIARYNLAMVQLKDAWAAMSQKVSMALMPILSDLAEWFRSIGPGVVEIFDGAMRGLAATFNLIWLGLDVLFAALKYLNSVLIDLVGGGVAVIVDVLRGDFKQAYKDATGAVDSFSKNTTEVWDTMVEQAKDRGKKIWKNLTGDTVQGGPGLNISTPSGSKAFTPPDEKKEVKGPTLMQRFNDELKALVQSNEAKANANGKYYEMSKEEEANFWLDKLVICNEKSQEYQDVLEKYQAAINASIKKGYEDSQKLAKEAYDNNVAYLRRELDLASDTSEKEREIRERLLEEDRRYSRDMLKIQEEYARQSKRYQFGEAMRYSFMNAFDSILTTTRSFGETMKQMFYDIYVAFVRLMVEQPLMAYLSGLAIKDSAERASSMKTIVRAAARAAAETYSALAGIPIVGPALATAASIGVFGAVMALGAFASAKGGYDVPAGINPLTQLHSQEMVLPADLANNIRSMSGGGGGQTINLHVHAVDAASVEKLFKNHGKSIAKSLRYQARNYVTVGA